MGSCARNCFNCFAQKPRSHSTIGWGELNESINTLILIASIGKKLAVILVWVTLTELVRQDLVIFTLLYNHENNPYLCTMLFPICTCTCINQSCFVNKDKVHKTCKLWNIHMIQLIICIIHHIHDLHVYDVNALLETILYHKQWKLTDNIAKHYS